MNKLIKSSLLIFLLFASSVYAETDSILGKWQTIDDTSQQPRSVVELYERNGKVFGKVVSIYLKPNEADDPVCEKCTGPLKNQKIIGMEIIQDMEKEGDVWTGGTILDPENGKRYNSKMWFSNGELLVRGYLLFFYRTQHWLPYKQ